MRSGFVLAVGVLGAAVLACGNYKEPTYGEPGDIIDKRLPGDTGSSDEDPPPGGGDDEDAMEGLTATALPLSAVEQHTAKGGPAHADTLDCLKSGCHDGALVAPKFVAAGKFAVGADIMIVTSGGNLGPITADKDGYFWFTSGALDDSATPWSRKGTGKGTAMVTPLSGAAGASCARASCHDGNTAIVR